MALVGNDATTREQRALKIGLSIADLIAAHVSALSIVARLGLKGSVPEGGLLDISMLRSLAWMTQLAWPERNETLPNGIVLECADGYVFSLNPQARQETLLGGTSRSLSVAAVLAQFKVTEVFAVEVREPYAVLKANLTVERELLQWVQAGEEWVPLLTTPHRWSSAVPKVTSCITAFSFS